MPPEESKDIWSILNIAKIVAKLGECIDAIDSASVYKTRYGKLRYTHIKNLEEAKSMEVNRFVLEALPSYATLIKHHGIFNLTVKELKNPQQQHEFDKQWGLTVIPGSRPV